MLTVSSALAKPPSAKPSDPVGTEDARLSAPPRVDSAKVHRLYLDGEFDAAIAMLEDNLKETRQYRHGDSVFIFKHLGVMYAAQYETREKGKYFMHKLLSVEPTARIMDMYASDMIYMIFKNIQEEFEQNRMLLGDARHRPVRDENMPARDNLENRPERPSHPHKPHAREKASGGKGWVWAGATVAAVAVGVGAFYLINADSEPKVNRTEVEF